MKVADQNITAQEASLLTLLTRRLDYPVPFTHIIETLWDKAADGGALDTGKSIRVLIVGINKKILKVGYKIVNVRGYGYKIVKLQEGQTHDRRTLVREESTVGTSQANDCRKGSSASVGTSTPITGPRERPNSVIRDCKEVLVSGS